MSANKLLALSIGIPAAMLSLSAAATQFDQPGDGPFFGESATGQWMVGAKAISARNSDKGFESASGGGIILGYEFSRPVWKGKAAFEFQYTDPGDGDINANSDPSPSVYPSRGKWENPVYAGYIAYRTPGMVYAKGKLGILSSGYKIKLNNGEIIEEKKTQIGYGLGLGIHAGRHVDLELEYEGNQGKSQLYDFGFNAIVKFP
jgi:opacity protein-like surface antigen